MEVKGGFASAFRSAGEMAAITGTNCSNKQLYNERNVLDNIIH